MKPALPLEQLALCGGNLQWYIYILYIYIYIKQFFVVFQ